MSLFNRILKKPVSYVEGRVDEVRHQLREDATEGLALASIYIVLAVILVIGILLISIAMAYLLGRWLGIVWGFLIIGFLYMIGALIYYNHFKKSENQRWIKERIGSFLNGKADNTVEIIEEEPPEPV